MAATRILIQMENGITNRTGQSANLPSTDREMVPGLISALESTASPAGAESVLSPHSTTAAPRSSTTRRTSPPLRDIENAALSRDSDGGGGRDHPQAAPVLVPVDPQQSGADPA